MVTKPPTINVLVTGFGPFPDGKGGHHTVNASHEITFLLPSTLEPHTPSNPSSAHITLLNPTAGRYSYLRTEYAYIRWYLSDLHASSCTEVTLYVHLGMAAGWSHVAVERAAFRQGFSSAWSDGGSRYYTRPDDVGQTVDDVGACPWEKCPVGLAPDVDVDGVVEDARAVLSARGVFEGQRGKGMEIVPHEEAGSYCCGYTFYESLAHRYSKGLKRNVLFVHVPGETDRASLERARDAVLAVIVAAVQKLV
ncbi:hypothetical protein ANO11243_032810 [Dothideomycetidae sp. 11243]|nr:hypothetical protein ANO11243_032810 [fungal sp. No.11243]